MIKIRTLKPSKFYFLLRDYHYNLLLSNDVKVTNAISSTKYPLPNCFSYSHLFDGYRGFSKVPASYEPQYFHQAVKFPHWQQAMYSELAAMESNST